MLPVTWVAQLLSTMMQSDTVLTPEKLGHGEELLLGVHPTQFADVNMVMAIGENITEYKHRFATMLYTQTLPWTDIDGTLVSHAIDE